MISNRENDMAVEREIAKYLDKYLYSNTDIFKEYARTDTTYERLKGSDVILSTSDGLLYRTVVDEKVAAKYANTQLNSFALELSFINRHGDKSCGWFLDYSKNTEYYLFGWINKADIPHKEGTNKYETNAITAENIKELEWALVSRRKIQKFLEKSGWTLDRLARQDEKIRENEGVKTKGFIGDVAFRYSGEYVEKPVNLLLKRETYIKLSDYHGIIKTE